MNRPLPGCHVASRIKPSRCDDNAYHRSLEMLHRNHPKPRGGRQARRRLPSRKIIADFRHRALRHQRGEF
jgi:hypothetical protein